MLAFFNEHLPLWEDIPAAVLDPTTCHQIETCGLTISLHSRHRQG